MIHPNYWEPNVGLKEMLADMFMGPSIFQELLKLLLDIFESEKLHLEVCVTPVFHGIGHQNWHPH